MADTKQGRDKQAADEAKRQRKRDLQETRERRDEAEPTRDDSDVLAACYRRGCNEPAAFVVLERYQEEGGHGPVEAQVELCETHTADESPVNLDAVYDEYVFRVEPLSDSE